MAGIQVREDDDLDWGALVIGKKKKDGKHLEGQLNTTVIEIE